MPVLVDAVEPQRDLRELERHRVEVHSVDVAVGDVVPHLLQLVAVPVVWDSLPEFSLLAVEVFLAELVHRFVEECGGAHGRLADGDLEDSIGRHVVRNQLLQGVLDDAASKGLGGVIACRLLALATGQAVDERTPRMDPELPPPLLVAVVDLLLVLVLVEVPGRHEPRARESVRVVARLLDFVEVLLGEEAAVGEQRFVDRAQLVDAELGVRDAPAPSPPALGRATQGHEPDHLLEHPVAELHPVEVRHCLGAEQAAVEGADGESVAPDAATREEIAAHPLESISDQPKQGLDAVVQVVAVQGFFARQAAPSRGRAAVRGHSPCGTPPRRAARSRDRAAPRYRRGRAAGTCSEGIGGRGRRRARRRAGRRGPLRPRGGTGSPRCR